MALFDFLSGGINGGRPWAFWLGGAVLGLFGTRLFIEIYSQHGTPRERMRLIDNQQLPDPAE